MEELGPLYAPMHEVDYFWIVLVLIALPVVWVAAVTLIRGELPRKAGGAAALLVPLAGYVLGNLHVLDESKSVAFCGSCHVTMPPLVESMKMEGKDLASLHYRAGAVSRKAACYQCHSGYGLRGDFQAKLAGISHMLHTIADTNRYPLKMRSTYDISACLDCHAETPAFQEIKGHRTLGIQNQLVSGEIGCTGACHDPAHPRAALYGTEAWEEWKAEQ